VWVTDGTPAGTHQVADIYPGGIALSPTLLGIIGTDLIFAEATSDDTMQLFRTDGTAAGTHALSSFATSRYGAVTESVEVNGRLCSAALKCDLLSAGSLGHRRNHGGHGPDRLE